MDDLEPAFPASSSFSATGMTLRDYFAAAVLPSVRGQSASNEGAARLAYELADAMLKERARPVTPQQDP